MYEYRPHGMAEQQVLSGAGALLAGLISTGVGESTLPRLVRRSRVPVAVAAATSTVVVAVTVAGTAVAHLVELAREGGLSAIRRRLLNDLTHELRTPLTTLDGYLEGLRDGIDLDLHVPPGPPVVAHADPDRLGQVLSVLLTNARLHSPRSSTVTVRFAASGQHAIFTLTLPRSTPAT